MREFAVSPLVTIDDRATLVDPVWSNAETSPQAVQFVRPTGSGDDWAGVSCAEFRDEVDALARGLIASGVRHGDRVALMSRTRYEWSLVDYAIWACGAVTVPIYETSSAEQVQWILSDSAAVACVVETGAHRAIVGSLLDGLPALHGLWQIEGGAPAERLAALVEQGGAVDTDRAEQRRRATRADDLATIIYTSGTTGRPKGCELTHRNIAADIRNALPILAEQFHEGGSTLLFLPLAHSFARLIQVGCVEARVTMRHSADIKNLVADLQQFRPTFVLSVPRVFEKVFNTAERKARADGKGAIFGHAAGVAIAYSEALDRPGGPGLLLRAQHALFDRLVYGKLRAALGGRCTTAISGGAPLGARLAHFFRGVGVTILEGYGLTETSPASAVNVCEALRIGTVGRPLPGVTIRIAEDGEILIAGEHVFVGYWNNEAATAEALDGDRWFHTGDIGTLDGDGYLTITGRKKELIVTAGGKNVAPAVLEDRLRAHPLISQCMVVGDRRPFIAALVTIDEEAFEAWKTEHHRPTTATVADLVDDEDLRGEVRKAVDDANLAVSQAEAIRAFRILPRDFSEATGEMTPSLKVKRNVVLKEYADEIARIYHG